MYGLQLVLTTLVSASLVVAQVNIQPQPDSRAGSTAGACQSGATISPLTRRLLPPTATKAGSARLEATLARVGPNAGPNSTAALSDNRMTSLTPSGCNPPPPVRSTFSPNDGAAFNWISVSGVSSGDTIEWDFYAPDGSRYNSSNFTASFSGNGCFWGGIYIQGYQAASLPGDWQVKVLYNGQVITTDTFTIAASSGKTICRNELSTFFFGAVEIGVAWVRSQDPSGYPQPSIVSLLMTDLATAKTNLGIIPCISFDYSQFDSLAATIGSLSANDAANAVGQLITQFQGAVQQASLSCDLKVDLMQLYILGVHLGAAGSRASLTVCSPIPAASQADINSHLSVASMALAAYKGCALAAAPIPTSIAFNPARPYDAYAQIVGMQEQVLWAVALSDCCCICPQ